MEIRNLLVNLDVDASTTSNALKLAVDLAARFDARVSAVAAAAPPADLIGVEGSLVVANLYEAERDAMEGRFASLESAFAAEVPVALRGNFVASLEAPTGLAIKLARGADLVVVQSQPEAHGYAHSLDVGSVLLGCGRPVLVCASNVAAIKADRIVIGWKDTREARRAVADALPFLERAEDVVIIGVDNEGLEQRGGLDDMLAWARSHGVKARRDVRHAVGSHGESLIAALEQTEADLLVTGAYGRSRLTERIFGGVTRELLGAQGINRFMSN